MKLLVALALLGIWFAADNLTQYIPDWVGYVVLLAVAASLFPLASFIKRTFWED